MKRQILFLSILLLLFLNSEYAFSQLETSGTTTSNNLAIDSVNSNAITLQKFAQNSIEDFWSLTGNSNATSSSFLGTINSEPLRFRVANQERLQITRKGRFHIEYLPLQNLYFGQNAGNEDSYLISFNTAFGINALSKNTGAINTAVGFNALKENTNSDFNTAIGSEALVANTTGGYNTSVGAYSLRANVDGRFNTAMGMQSLKLNVSGNNNTAFGYRALDRITANNNTAIGYDAGYNFDGLSNVFVGYRSGPLNGAPLRPSGNRNVFIGANDYVSGGGFGTIGNNNIYIGSDLQYFNGDNNLNIGDKIYGSGTGINSAIGIGVPLPQARLHTLGTVRLQGLPSSSTLPINVLGTDNLGNVYNFNPNLIGSNATITNNLVSNNNTITSTVNGIASSTSLINSVNNSLVGSQFTTVINGISSLPITLPEAVLEPVLIDSYIGTRLRPINPSVNGFNILKNTNTAIGYRAINSNTTGNAAVAAIGAGINETNNYADVTFIAHFGPSYYVPKFAGNGGLLSDKDLFIGTYGINKSIDFVTGNTITSTQSRFKIESDNIASLSYPNTRNDVLNSLPINFLYTDSNGKFLSAPISSIVNSISTDNIYTANGSLTSNRLVNLNDFNLNFSTNQARTILSSNPFNPLNSKSVLEIISSNVPVNPNLIGSGFFKINQEKSERYLTQGINADGSWLQSSENPRNVSNTFPLLVNPLGGNVGVGVLSPTAQLHTISSVRFEDLPYQKSPNALLGTDADGNVFNYDPSVLGGSNGNNIYNVNGTLTDNRYLNLDNKTLGFYGNNFTQVYDTNINTVKCPTGSSGESFSTINGYQSDVIMIGEPSIFMGPNYNNGYFKLKANQSSRAGTSGNQLNFGIGNKNSWMQSSTHYLTSRDGYCGNANSNLHLNPLGGNVGIGVSNATAQLHTTKSVRFEGLPFNANKPIGVLGTDLDGNVFNFDPSTFGTGGASADAWLLNGNSGTNPGTGSGENFLGTIDEKDLVFGVNANEKIRIKPSGRIQLFGWSPTDGANSAYNIFIGGGNDTSEIGNIAIGTGSMINNNEGKYNTALGFSTLENNTTGVSNTSIGFQSLRMNTTGHSNSSVGVNSLFNNTTGEYNVSMGTVSLLENTTGSGNVGIGAGNLKSNKTGNANTAVGTDALRDTNGTYNVAVGVGALSSLGSDVSIGDGGTNIALGSFAGKDLKKGDYNILIGYDVQGSVSNTSDNQLNIGNWIFGKNGQIAIGNFTDLPQSFLTNNDYQLIVKKGIRTEKVRVDISSVKNWSDYVFEKDYKLMPLNEVKQFIDINGHLPNIPSAEEVVKDGIDLGAMDAKLLEKIEELTLYTIELNTKNQELQKTKLEQDKLIQNLADRLEKLEKKDKQ